MRNIKKTILNQLRFWGVDLRKVYQNLSGFRFYFRDLRELKRQKGDDNTFYFGQRRPILNERYSEGGTMKGHYFHQDLYVARLIFKNQPQKHIDIGSRTDGFVAHVASFRNIEMFDIRKINSSIENIKFKQADLMNLPDELIDYCDSVSSLHAIEHFGLGRYNDPIDYLGHEKAIANITKILKKNGIFYFSVPIGKQRIEFNAHRIFSVEYLLKILTKDFTVKHFSFVDDLGNFHENVSLENQEIANNYNCTYGCGIFELIKK